MESSDLERQIAELEKEVGGATYPFTREKYVREKLRAGSSQNPAQIWLELLRDLKRLKDSNPRLYQKLLNWD